MVSREKGKIPIRKILEKRDIDLYHRIETLWKEAHELQERQLSKEHHQQGYLHCAIVEKNLGKIILDRGILFRFSTLELFLLSAAACYHDVGKSENFSEGHATVAMRDIYSHPEKYHLSDPEGKVLSMIIGSHDIDDVFNDTPEIYPIGSDDVRVKLLSALFRLADVLHTDNSRIPHIVVGDVKKLDDKTRFRKLIQGWSFIDELQIMLKATPEDTNDINIIAKGVSMMQKQLECVSPVLRSEGYPYEIIYSCDNRKIKWDAETQNKRNLIEMDFYTENEADIFKGRDIESEGLLKKVIGSNISLLIGNSGVGKTSLIRAGLFPKLSKIGWKCIWTRPVSPMPLDRILNDINVNLPVGCESTDIISSVKKFSERIGTNDIIIAIDQFEDILRSHQLVKDELGKILLRIYGKSFRNVHILLSYRGDYEPEINSFLDNSGIINPSRFPLLGLDTTGAHDALRSIFETNNVGISDELIDRIVKELKKESEHGKFYPPFIQIVASSLINLAGSNGGIITEELYNNEVSNVETIVGEYLINRLNEFGDINSEKRKNTEAILKELVRDGVKEQKEKDELRRYLNIPEDELKELLDILVNKRLIRHLGNNNYEIIHDFLASKVEEMIMDEERPLRGARDILRIKSQHYRYMSTPSLLEPNEMIILYSHKESILPNTLEKELLMFSYLAGKGPVWFWFNENEDFIYRDIIKKALFSDNSEVRAGASIVFQHLATNNDLSFIRKMLNNSDYFVRITAVKAFVRFATYDDFDQIKKLLKDSDGDVRRFAIKAFEKFSTSKDLKPIKDLLDDSDGLVRGSAVRTLAKFGTHDDLPIIIDMFEDPYEYVRKIAVEAFGKLATHDDIIKIIPMLKDLELCVRKTALKSFLNLITPNDSTIINKMIIDSYWDVRKAAIETFPILYSSNLSMIRNFLKDTDSKEKIVAIEAFTRTGTKESLEIINDMLKNSDSTLRMTAIEAFGELGNHDDLVIIKDMLKDVNNSVRETAVKAVGKLGIHDDLLILKDLLDDSDEFVRIATIETFINLGTYDDLKLLTEKLQDFYEDERIAVIRAIEKFGAIEYLALVVDMMKDSNKDVRKAAVEAFKKLGTYDDLKIINDMLEDKDLSVRVTALETIAELGTHEDLTKINYMLNDSDSYVRIDISNFIMYIGKINDLEELVINYTNGNIINQESLNCIIALDEKLYSPFEEFNLISS